jgi:hypothetical protein
MTTAVVAMVLALGIAVVVISVFSHADEAPAEAEETRLGDLLEP